MKATDGRESISVWRPADVCGVELHRGVGVSRVVARHWHEEYQLCLIEEGAGELAYRGVRHATPAASLFVVHPGEIHSNRADDGRGCSYRSLFVEPGVMRRAAEEVSGRAVGAPFFGESVLFERAAVGMFARLHVAMERPASSLERESLLLAFSTGLVARFGERGPGPSAAKAKRAGVERACEYLRECYAENVSLESLAGLAGLSPSHFSRVFTGQVGMPPHAFQTQVRVARARALLACGWPISQAAAQTGFADQSHLTRHFKRLTGVTPGQYRRAARTFKTREGAHV